MKVIVIHDSDGHTSLYKDTPKNQKIVMDYLIKSGHDFEEDVQNKELEDYYIVNARGSQIHVLEIQDDAPINNPFL